jgi:hypothetical protein
MMTNIMMVLMKRRKLLINFFTPCLSALTPKPCIFINMLSKYSWLWQSSFSLLFLYEIFLYVLKYFSSRCTLVHLYQVPWKVLNRIKWYAAYRIEDNEQEQLFSIPGPWLSLHKFMHCAQSLSRPLSCWSHKFLSTFIHKSFIWYVTIVNYPDYPKWLPFHFTNGVEFMHLFCTLAILLKSLMFSQLNVM